MSTSSLVATEHPAFVSPVAHSSPEWFVGMQSGASCKRQFKFNASGVQCDGLTHASEADISAEACAKRCCDLQADGTCSVWQWCDPKTDGCGCWYDASAGIAPQCSHVHSAGPWIGASTTPIVPSSSVVHPDIMAAAAATWQDSNEGVDQRPIMAVHLRKTGGSTLCDAAFRYNKGDWKLPKGMRLSNNCNPPIYNAWYDSEPATGPILIRCPAAYLSI